MSWAESFALARLIRGAGQNDLKPVFVKYPDVCLTDSVSVHAPGVLGFINPTTNTTHATTNGAASSINSVHSRVSENGLYYAANNRIERRDPITLELLAVSETFLTGNSLSYMTEYNNALYFFNSGGTGSAGTATSRTLIKLNPLTLQIITICPIAFPGNFANIQFTSKGIYGFDVVDLKIKRFNLNTLVLEATSPTTIVAGYTFAASEQGVAHVYQTAADGPYYIVVYNPTTLAILVSAKQLGAATATYVVNILTSTENSIILFIRGQGTGTPVIYMYNLFSCLWDLSDVTQSTFYAPSNAFSHLVPGLKDVRTSTDISTVRLSHFENKDDIMRFLMYTQSISATDPNYLFSRYTNKWNPTTKQYETMNSRTVYIDTSTEAQSAEQIHQMGFIFPRQKSDIDNDIYMGFKKGTRNALRDTANMVIFHGFPESTLIGRTVPTKTTIIGEPDGLYSGTPRPDMVYNDNYYAYVFERIFRMPTIHKLVGYRKVEDRDDLHF